MVDNPRQGGGGASNIQPLLTLNGCKSWKTYQTKSQIDTPCWLHSGLCSYVCVCVCVNVFNVHNTALSGMLYSLIQVASTHARLKQSLMPRLYLAVLTTRNETWSFWKQLFNF